MRWRRRHASVERFEPTGVKDALFVFDVPSAGARYRSGHLSEELRLAGGTCDAVQTDIVDLIGAVEHYRLFVLNRVRWRDEVAVFLDAARREGRPVLFDTDDLVFDPELADHLAFMENWPEQSRRKEIAELDAYRRTLAACDGVTVSTEPLAEHARRVNEHIGVVFNAVSEEMRSLAQEALNRTRAVDDDVCIAYLSGTRTHNRDFLAAADALVWTLDTYPATRLLLIGKLDLDERFERFGSRVRRVGLQPWRELAAFYREIDINLAPLEAGNPFTECKSCVKYLEAALLGVPTVASARPDFRRVIEHGRNGLLADTPDEWRDCLSRLVESAELREGIGRVASDSVNELDTTVARAPALQRALEDVGVAQPAK